LGSGITGSSVSVLTVSHDQLYAGGYFTGAGGVPAANIAVWGGSSWSGLGSGTDNPVWAMTSYNGAVIVGGLFERAGGRSMLHVAQWSKPCCQGRVGDVNGEGVYPDEVTLGDIMLLVDVKFVSGDCSKLPCLTEADVNQGGGANPNCDDHITLGDIMTLVDFLFITCPENGTLPECL